MYLGSSITDWRYVKGDLLSLFFIISPCVSYIEDWIAILLYVNNFYKS